MVASGAYSRNGTVSKHYIKTVTTLKTTSTLYTLEHHALLISIGIYIYIYNISLTRTKDFTVLLGHYSSLIVLVITVYK